MSPYTLLAPPSDEAQEAVKNTLAWHPCCAGWLAFPGTKLPMCLALFRSLLAALKGGKGPASSMNPFI